jgi:chorismate mutase
MKPEDILNNAIESIKSGIDTVENNYELHIREKAIKEVNKKIEEKGLNVEQIQNDDYEAMISDLSKDIKADYAKKAAQGLFAFIGLDMILGI